MSIQKAIAANLRRFRVERGLSQESLAFEAQLDRTYISRLERAMENPTVGVLTRIAVVLGVRITNFFSTPMPGAIPQLRVGRRPKTSRK